MPACWRILFASVLAFCFGVAHGQATESSNPTILVLGDSLSAEYGIRRDSGWVKIIQQRLANDGLTYQLQNASISGDTTSGGLSRLPAALERYSPEIVIIELGSNDALRGLSLSATRANLDEMVRLSGQAGARVLLVGMQIQPNYGREYAQQFKDLFVSVAGQYGTAIVPFLMEGMALDRSMFQADGIHPNEEAQ